MNYAQERSENTAAEFSVQPSRIEATVHRLDCGPVAGLIWPSDTEVLSGARLLARIRQLEEQLAELEHMLSVRRGMLASAASFHAAWDDEPADSNNV